MYVTTVFIRGLTMPEICKFLHHGLGGIQLADYEVLTTKEAMDQLVQVVLLFIQNRKRAVFRAHPGVISPLFYHELKTIVERERPSYHVLFKNGIVTVKYKSLYNKVV
uniref:Smr domain-containing protein n=1 Tax=Panagrellus redivivus TaxID=6233 RepID=A0A7E4W544_PANRE